MIRTPASRTRAMPSRALPTLLSSVLAGCTLAPHFQQPALPVAPAYPASAQHSPADATLGTAADSLGWRDFFVDPRLQRLIALSLRENRDLRTAVLDVAQSQAQFRVQRADLFPSISLTGSGSYQGLSNSGLIGTGGSSGTSASSATTSATGTGTGTSTTASAGASTSATPSGSSGGTFRYFTAGVGFSSYELDLFGRLRSLTRQAFENYLAQRENRRAEQLTVISTVASDYIAVLSDQQQIAVTQDTLRAQRDTVALTQAEFDHGATTLLTLRQAQTSVATAEANLAQYQRQLVTDQNALVLAVGAPLPDDLPPPAPLGAQTLLVDLPAGLPSDLLTRRPDILKAEHTLRGAYADIGAARAAFFPQITLTASDGLQSLKLSQLFTSGATTWSFSPQITVPIFTWGQNRANLDLAKIQKDLDVVSYEQAIQTAFQEVSNALAARGTYVEQLRAQQANVDESSDYYRLAKMRFDAGVDTYLTTLDAQRTLYAARQSLISVRETQLQNLVTLYRALGGGWNETTVPPPPPPIHPAAVPAR
jgi:multidrug efflux system outer membrane protein